MEVGRSGDEVLLPERAMPRIKASGKRMMRRMRGRMLCGGSGVGVILVVKDGVLEHG